VDAELPAAARTSGHEVKLMVFRGSIDDVLRKVRAERKRLI
jgi:hypothetical protein